MKAKTAIVANTVAEDIWEIGGANASNQFKLALKLVNLDTKIDVDTDIFSGPPDLQSIQKLEKTLDKRIILEIKRFREEFFNV